MPNIKIREATVEDIPLIFSFIKQLAIYKKAEDAVVVSEEDIKKSIFLDTSTAYALIALLDDKAVKNNCGRFEWSVLDWNQPAINFYQSIGDKP